MDIDISTVPETVLTEASSLQNFLVAMFVVSEQPMPRVSPIGSGTLVELEGSHYILTAAHVWNEARQAKDVGLALTASPSQFLVPRNLIQSRQLWVRKHPEWGPDLALLQLPPSDVARIKARKSFLNLAEQRAAFAARPPNTLKGYWAVTGMVGEFSTVEVDHEARIIQAGIGSRAFFTAIRDTHDRAGYDYFDVGAKLELPGTPFSFGGVSGGGLWEIGLTVAKSGDIVWDGKRQFRGVAFWESPPSRRGRRVIRCHGPHSIFKRAWASSDLPPCR